MQDINKILIDATQDHKMEVPAEAWPFIADALRKRKKRRVVWFFLSFLAVFVLSTSAIFFYKNGKPNKVETHKEVSMAENNSIRETKIAETDTVIYKNPITVDTIITESNKNLKNETKIIEAVTSLHKKTASIDATIIETNKKIKKDSESYLNSSNTGKELYRKKLLREKTKSRFKLSIKAPVATEDAEGNLSNTKIKREEEVSTVIKNNVTALDNEINIVNDSSKNITFKKDTIVDKTTITKTIAEKEIEKIELQKASIKIANKNKWNAYLGLSYGAVFVSNKNLLGNEDKVAFASSSQVYGAAAQLTADVGSIANYYTGREISLSFLLKKENKKLQPLIGINLTIGNFNTKAYQASAADLDANTFAVDSSQRGNSIYAAKNTLGSSQLNVKNNFMEIGLLLGCNIPLHTFKQGNKISLLMQVIPTYNLSQSIQWFDKASTRYFTSNELINNFNINQSLALLWETNIKRRTISVGPYFNFNYLSFNKDVNNVANIYVQSFGIHIYLKLNK